MDLRLGDCLEILPTLPAGSVDLVVTSPPYNLGIAYKTFKDTAPHEEFLSWCRAWAAEVRRVLADNGSFFLNVGAAPANPAATDGRRRRETPPFMGCQAGEPQYTARIRASNAGAALREGGRRGVTEPGCGAGALFEHEYALPMRLPYLGLYAALRRGGQGGDFRDRRRVAEMLGQ